VGAVKTLQNCDIPAKELEARFAGYTARPVHRPEFRPAGVLVPLFPSPGGCQLLLTRRPQNLSRHGGQISFPGGAMDPEDADLRHTALRESQEEVGLAPERVRLLGELDHVWTPSGFVLVPFVGWIAEGSVGAADPHEVEEVLWVEVADLMAPGVYREEVWEREGTGYRISFFDVACGTVWGATARVLVRMLQVGFGWTGVEDKPWEITS